MSQAAIEPALRENFHTEILSLATSGVIQKVLPSQRVSPYGDRYHLARVAPDDGGEQTVCLIEDSQYRAEEQCHLEGLRVNFVNQPGGLKVKALDGLPLESRLAYLDRVEASRELTPQDANPLLSSPYEAQLLRFEEVNRPITPPLDEQEESPAVDAINKVVAHSVEQASKHNIPVACCVFIPPKCLY